MYNFNPIIEGLQIVQGCFPNAQIGADHDMIYVYGTVEEPIGSASFEPTWVEELTKRGWAWNDRFQSWTYLL